MTFFPSSFVMLIVIVTDEEKDRAMEEQTRLESLIDTPEL